MSQRRIILCADDYAIAPGVSKAIRALIAQGRLNATTAMTVFPEFKIEAAALAATQSPIKLSVGLHVTLTGGYKPLAASPMSGTDNRLPMFPELANPLKYHRIDRQAIEAEIEAQLKAFRSAFGRAPDFVDGHQHVQLLPAVRAPFLAAVARGAPQAWVRQCGPARVSGYFTDIKNVLIAWGSISFRSAARRKDLAMNPAFAGAYDLWGNEDITELFDGFLEDLPDGGLVMCHPGFVDEELLARDPLTYRRETEYAFLAGIGLPNALARADATLKRE
jgi:predicted glycoside hydrolase/deacetylase ChbG (UPF0249 family)